MHTKATKKRTPIPSFPLMFNELEIKLGKQYPRCIKFDLNRSNNIFPYLELIQPFFCIVRPTNPGTTTTDANNGQLDRRVDILWELRPCTMLLKRQPRGDAVHQNKDKIVKFLG